MHTLLFWRLGGNQVANIYQCSLNGPSVSYLRRRSIVPAIIPSHAQPTVEQVCMNVNSTFESISSLLQQLGRLHVVAMFDEVAAEKQIRWDPKTNYFLGVCREHAEKILMEFINEKDMEEVFRCLDEGEIHYAGKVRTMTAWVIFTSVPRADLAIFRVLLAFCAMIIAYTQHVQCLHLAIVKNESSEEHTKLIQTFLDGISESKYGNSLHVISLASDGETW